MDVYDAWDEIQMILDDRDDLDVEVLTCMTVDYMVARKMGKTGETVEDIIDQIKAAVVSEYNDQDN